MTHATRHGSWFYRALLCVLILVVTPFTAQAARIQSESFTLSNGLQVVVIPNTKVPAVSHMVWYKVGGMDEVPGTSGIAHFLEHLMFKGTPTCPLGEFSKRIAKTGGNDNAFTTKDYTAYFQNVSRDKLEMVMAMEADRMHNLMFVPAEIDKERNVIIEERRMRTDNSPGGLLSEQMMAALFLNHPYHIPVIGWLHEMQTLSIDDAKQFYNRYYAPNNAILIVSGDITAAELKPLAEKYYGSLTPRAVPPRLHLQEPPAIAPRTVSLTDAKVQSPEWSRYYIAPNATDRSSYAITLLSYVMGESATSQLYQHLVVEQHVASSISTSYDTLKRGPGIFSIYAVPAPGVTLQTLEKAIDTQIASIIATPPGEADITRAKDSLIASEVYDHEDLKTLAYAYGQALAVGLSTDDVEKWDDRINHVTRKEIAAAAANVLLPQASVTGYLLPATTSGGH